MRMGGITDPLTPTSPHSSGGLLRRIGKKKAAVAVGHSILVICWHILTNDYVTTKTSVVTGSPVRPADQDKRRDNLIGELQRPRLRGHPLRDRITNLPTTNCKDSPYSCGLRLRSCRFVRWCPVVMHVSEHKLWRNSRRNPKTPQVVLREPQ